MDSSASRDSTQIILKGSAVVVGGLIALGTVIPIIGNFAKVLQKALEVIKQASSNEDAIARLHNHALDISDGLLLHLFQLSKITGFDNALKKIMDLLEDISNYINKHQTSLLTKVSSAADTKFVTQVDNYIQNLTDRKDILMDLIAIDTNVKLTYLTEAKMSSEDHNNSTVPVHQVLGDSSIDEETISKNKQESKKSNNERSTFLLARDKFEKNPSNNK